MKRVVTFLICLFIFILGACTNLKDNSHPLNLGKKSFGEISLENKD